MATTLLIVKNAGVEGNWSHFFSTLGELEESRFYVTIFNGMFQIKEENGGVIEAVLFSNITVRDDSSGGTLYVITSIPQLQALLIALKYPAYVPLVNTNGVLSVTGTAVDNTDPQNPIINSTGGGTTYIVDGITTTVTGTGTVLDPYVIEVSGGGSIPTFQEIYDSGLTDPTTLDDGLGNVLTATPTDIQMTDGVNTLVIAPTAIQSSNTDSQFALFNDSGNASLDLQDSDTKRVILSGVNGIQLATGVNLDTDDTVFKSKIKSDNLTAQRVNQTPDADGTLGVSVKVNGTSYPFGTDGETSDIVISGGGAVDSVNGQTGVVVLDADDISDTSTTNKWTNASEKATWNNGITGQITIISSDGTRQIITPSLDTNASRGTALQSAKTSAVSGDVIFVNNGVYDTYDLAKDGITYYFEAGAVIESTENTAQSFIFSDNGSAITFKVLGDGVFRHLGTGTQENIIHNTAASNFYIEAYSMYSQYGRITQNYAADLTIKAHTLSGALGVDIIGNTDLNTKTTVYADLLSVTSGYALEHDGGILSAYVKEIVNTGSVTAITTETGLGTLYIETAKITSNSAFPLEIFNVDTNVIIVGAQIFATGSHYYTTSNSLYFSGCYDEDFNTTLTGTGTPIYLTTSGGGGGTIDPVPTDGSTNAVESNGVFDALETKENATNKQDSLATDGTGVKFPTVDAVNTALALKQDNPNVILDLTDYPTTATLTTLHVVSSHVIPANTLSNNSILKYMTSFDRTGTAGTSSMGIYLDTSAGTIGSAVSGTAVLIAACTMATTGRLPNVERTFKLASNLLTGYPAGVNSPTDAVAVTSALTATPLTPATTYYLITGVINNSAADIVTQRMTSLTQIK